MKQFKRVGRAEGSGGDTNLEIINPKNSHAEGSGRDTNLKIGRAESSGGDTNPEPSRAEGTVQGAVQEAVHDSNVVQPAAWKVRCRRWPNGSIPAAELDEAGCRRGRLQTRQFADNSGDASELY